MASDRANGSSPTRLPEVGNDVPSAEPDWTDQVTDMVVDLVEQVRDKTNGPVLKAARIAVYGIVLFLVGVTILVLLLITFGRLAALFPGPLWIPYAVMGLVLCIGGAVVWPKRHVT